MSAPRIRPAADAGETSPFAVWVRALTSDGAFADVELDVDGAGDALIVACSVDSPRGHLLVVEGRFLAAFTPAWVELVRAEASEAGSGGGGDEDEDDVGLAEGPG